MHNSQLFANFAANLWNVVMRGMWNVECGMRNEECGMWNEII